MAFGYPAWGSQTYGPMAAPGAQAPGSMDPIEALIRERLAYQPPMPAQRPGGFLRRLLAGLGTRAPQPGAIGGFQAGISGAFGQGEYEQAQAERARQDAMRMNDEALQRTISAGQYLETGRHNRAMEAKQPSARVAGLPEKAQVYNFLTESLHMDPKEALVNSGLAGPGAGGGEKATAFMQNVQYLMNNGYSYEDAVAMVQRLVPTISTGTIYDPYRGQMLPTTGSRTPQVPGRGKRAGTGIGPNPSHKPTGAGANPLEGLIR